MAGPLLGPLLGHYCDHCCDLDSYPCTTTFAPLCRDHRWDHDWDHSLGPLFGTIVWDHCWDHCAALDVSCAWGIFHNGPLLFLQRAHRETMDNLFVQWTSHLQWTIDFVIDYEFANEPIDLGMDHAFAVDHSFGVARDHSCLQWIMNSCNGQRIL